MSEQPIAGSLYGIKHSNRDGENLWGKNQFNSTFPIALSCYMRDNDKKAVYVSLNDKCEVARSYKDFNFIFNTNQKNEKLYFNFESCFDAYDNLIYGQVERVDVVVGIARKQGLKFVQGEQLRALEVKLTVVPDSNTASKDPAEWGPELVIRPATTKYCALSIANNCRTERKALRKVFEDRLSAIKDWGNEAEALTILPQVIECLEEFQKKFKDKQIPLVLQPIWKTEGVSPILSEKAFDIFVWSNFALLQLIIDQAKNSIGKSRISRPARSGLRIARFLLEFSKSGKAHIDNIYDSMTFGAQSDKDFAVAGNITRKYLADPRLINPLMPRSVVENIILDGGISYLSPERRFDQSIYFLYGYEES